MPCSRAGGRTLPWGWAHDVQAAGVTHGIRVPPAKLAAQAQGAGYVRGGQETLGADQQEGARDRAKPSLVQHIPWPRLPQRHGHSRCVQHVLIGSLRLEPQRAAV